MLDAPINTRILGDAGSLSPAQLEPELAIFANRIHVRSGINSLAMVDFSQLTPAQLINPREHPFLTWTYNTF